MKSGTGAVLLGVGNGDWGFTQLFEPSKMQKSGWVTGSLVEWKHGDNLKMAHVVATGKHPESGLRYGISILSQVSSTSCPIDVNLDGQ